jgi:hypothetical protein
MYFFDSFHSPIYQLKLIFNLGDFKLNSNYVFLYQLTSKLTSFIRLILIRAQFPIPI